MSADISDMKRVITPLYNAHGWIKVAGVISVVEGILTALSIWGIAICWMSIWLGVLLYSTSNKMKQAYEDDHAEHLEEAMQKFARYFKLFAIFQILAAVIGFSAAILIPAFMKASQIAN